eukprot:SAG22_NODE_117_length_19289_cov_12.242574_6_plen_239_part_00
MSSRRPAGSDYVSCEYSNIHRIRLYYFKNLVLLNLLIKYLLFLGRQYTARPRVPMPDRVRCAALVGVCRQSGTGRGRCGKLPAAGWDNSSCGSAESGARSVIWLPWRSNSLNEVSAESGTMSLLRAQVMAPRSTRTYHQFFPTPQCSCGCLGSFCVLVSPSALVTPSRKYDGRRQPRRQPRQPGRRVRGQGWYCRTTTCGPLPSLILVRYGTLSLRSLFGTVFTSRHWFLCVWGALLF